MKYMTKSDLTEGKNIEFGENLAEAVKDMKSDITYNSDEPIILNEPLEPWGKTDHETSSSSDYKELDAKNIYNPDDPIRINDMPRSGYFNIPKLFDDLSTDKFLPRSDGKWEGNPGDSVWKPERDKIPENPKTNPEGKTWGEILDKYGIEGIPFKDGEPDFSEVSKGTVEIDDFSEDRDDNFDAADEKLAEQRGCTKEEVRK
jgi:hypothetical protein